MECLQLRLQSEVCFPCWWLGRENAPCGFSKIISITRLETRDQRGVVDRNPGPARVRNMAGL